MLGLCCTPLAGASGRRARGWCDGLAAQMSGDRAQVLAGTFSRNPISPTAEEIAADMELEAAIAEEARSGPAPLQQKS